MLGNYYKTAVRNIARSRFHAAINIIGLSIGMAFTLLIAVYCYSEWQVNLQLRHADRQYILTSNWKDPNLGYPMAAVAPLAKALKETYPALVANYYRFDGVISTVSHADRHFREDIQIGDSTLLPMYGFSLLYGDERTALSAPNSVVITADKAIKYFGHTDVVGEDLTIEDFSGGKRDFRITGVLPEPSRNSVTWLNESNNNRILLSMADLAWFGRNLNWARNNIVSFVELQPGVSPKALAAPIALLVRQNAPAWIADNMRVEPIQLSTYYRTSEEGTVQKMVYTLTAVSVFILVMAMINFINLSVSRSAARLKEIGIRKVLGGLKRQLVLQFLVESVVLSTIASLLALVLYPLFAPLLSGMLDKSLPSLIRLPVLVWPLIAVFGLTVGLLAGIYPALVLSSLPSVDAMKRRPVDIGSRALLRKGLIGFQFSMATIALVSAIVISQQIRLFFSSRLGYDKEYLVSAQLPRDWSLQGVRRMERIRAEFAGMPEVKAATLSFEIPDGGNSGSRTMWPVGGDSTRAVASQTLMTDEHYAGAYGISLVAGNFYNANTQSAAQDSVRVVLNETAVKALGWKTPQEAVGKQVRLADAPLPFTVSGVVGDFHFESMGSAIQPELLMHIDMTWTYRYLTVKLRPGSMEQTMERLRRKWAVLLPGEAFEYRFMDETLARVYLDELRLRKAASVATVLALVIVLLGVVGLVSLSIGRRMKEIAIRKTVGASVPDIIRLFLREYLPVFLLSGAIASAPAWWLMERWLQSYATRIGMTAWPFVAAIGALSVLMTALIAAQSLSAAVAAPVKALHDE